MAVKKLRLAKETLTELTTGELRLVLGASDHTLCVGCANDISFEKCPTLPLEDCRGKLTLPPSGR